MASTTSSKGCVAYNSTTSITFSSRREAANWLIAEGLTTFQPNTITKKIAAAIRDNTAAFGYTWKAIAAPTLTENHNIQELVKEDEEQTYGVERTPKQPFDPID